MCVCVGRDLSASVTDATLNPWLLTPVVAEECYQRDRSHSVTGLSDRTADSHVSENSPTQSSYLSVYAPLRVCAMIIVAPPPVISVGGEHGDGGGGRVLILNKWVRELCAESSKQKTDKNAPALVVPYVVPTYSTQPILLIAAVTHLFSPSLPLSALSLFSLYLLYASISVLHFSPSLSHS